MELALHCEWQTNCLVWGGEESNGEGSHFVVELLEVGKSAGVDEIRPEMLKAMGKEGVLWLSHVIMVAWDRGETHGD